jgi:hypothetical protein
VAAGRKPKKPPLPPTHDEIFKQKARHRLRKTLPLPANTEPLLPLASELMTTITNAELDHYKRARLEDPKLPAVTVSKNLGQRVAQAFHMLLKELEPTGITFRKFQGHHEQGYFKRHTDRLYLTITEDLVKPDGSRITPARWESLRYNEKPSGYLTFSVKPIRWSTDGTKHWSETAKLPLDTTLAQVVAGIRKHFLDVLEQREQQAIADAKRHAEWLLRSAQWEREEAIRVQKEKERKHAEALAATVQARRTALLKAADQWRLSRDLLQFVGECEARWKKQSDVPSAEQIVWLTWAREIAGAISPFSAGYPDPASDGTFDAALIPFGGPYPPTQNF